MQNKDDKKDMLNKMSVKRKKKLENMSSDERGQFLSDKREYARKRRDKNIVDDTRSKYEKMDTKAQSKFLDKILRYDNLVNEFKAEADSHRANTTS